MRNKGVVILAVEVFVQLMLNLTASQYPDQLTPLIPFGWLLVALQLTYVLLPKKVFKEWLERNATRRRKVMVGYAIAAILGAGLGLFYWAGITAAIQKLDELKAAKSPQNKLALDSLTLSIKISELHEQWKKNYEVAIRGEEAKIKNGGKPDYNLATKPITWRAIDKYRNNYKTDAIRLRDLMLQELPPGSRDDLMNYAFGEFPTNESEIMATENVAKELNRLGLLLQAQNNREKKQ